MKWWIVLLALAAILGGTLIFMKPESNPTRLRVAFPAARPALSYEPTNIHLDFEYIFLENIYSPLVEFDRDGVLQPGVAEKVETRGGEVRLFIRKNLKTENGTPITAADVAFSLKRLLVLSGNTHGNFRDLICPGVEMKSIEDNCPGLRVEGDTVVLNAGKSDAFLLPMLAAIDFAIIPKSSVDPKTLKIIDMKETSGPYYVDSDDGHGHIVLRANPNHYHFSRHIASEIDLVPILGKTRGESLEALLAGQVDHITTVDTSRSDEVLAFAKDHPEFHLHMTHKIRTLVLVFTEEGLKKFSAPERRLISAKVREAFHSIYQGVPGMEARDEFFPGLADGSLDAAQHAEIEKLKSDVAAKLPKDIRIGLLKKGDLEIWSGPLRKVLPAAEFSRETDAPDLEKEPTNVPDAFIAATDTGFMEDIGLISYSLNAGLLGLKKNERQTWLAKYMAINEKPERMKMLRELHFNALSSPVIVPLEASPYTALVRKPWKMELSELYANDQLWRIKHP